MYLEIFQRTVVLLHLLLNLVNENNTVTQKQLQTQC